jgi:hypothetical protein
MGCKYNTGFKYVRVTYMQSRRKEICECFNGHGLLISLSRRVCDKQDFEQSR